MVMEERGKGKRESGKRDKERRGNANGAPPFIPESQPAARKSYHNPTSRDPYLRFF